MNMSFSTVQKKIIVAMGPYLPISVLRRSVEYYESALESHLALKKNQVVLNKDYFEKLVWLAESHSTLVAQLKAAEYNEGRYVENMAFVKARFERKAEQLAESLKLCPIEEYGHDNPYSVLSIPNTDIDKVELEYVTPEYCADCVTWYLYHCECSKPIEYLAKKKRSAFKLSDNKNDYVCHMAACLRPKQANRNPLLSIKLRDYINFLVLNRTSNEAVVHAFITLFNMLDTDALVRPFTPAKIRNLLNYIEMLEVQGVLVDEVATEAKETVSYHPMREDGEQVVFDEDYINICQLKRTQVLENQMEAPHGECDTLVVEQEENVVLTTHAEESIAKPIDVDKGVWEKMCSPQNIKEYSQLMSRWQRWKVVKWTKDNSVGTKLVSEVLPKKFVTDQKDSPNCLLFKQYAYFRSDLEIKIVVNSNKFHCGSLQASFYYGATMDKYYKDRENVYSASQMTHCIIDAATSNDGILVIPYRHYKPLMSTIKRDDDNVILDMGAFRLMVLNQLQVPKNDTNTVDVTIFIRFVNPSFHGMKPSNLGVENQMLGMAALVKETANLVSQVYPDEQRDCPSDVRPPNPMVPWSSHSWCLGDLTPQPLNPLRMQATGNTPHPPGTLPEEPEMQLSYVARIFGLIKQVNWKTSDAEGTVLLKMPFSPELDEYYKQGCDNGGKYSCDVMPPVSVISALFAYWRGSLEYKLDFISTQFHTGRLIIAYLPRVVNVSSITIEQLTFCDHIIVDLRDEKQVLYTNAFLSDKPWYPRRSYTTESTEIFPPGYIYIAVLNSLTAVQTVADNIDINIYMRAGTDFEMHIPVSPRIGLSYNTKMILPKDILISYLDAYGPPNTDIYIDTWHKVKDKNVFRYGPVSDHITQFKTTDRVKGVMRLATPSDFNFKVVIGGLDKTVNYLVLFCLRSEMSGNTINYMYGAPFEGESQAILFYASLTEQSGRKVILEDSKEDQFKVSTDLMLSIDKASDYYPNNNRYAWRILTPKVYNQAGGDERKTECGTSIIVQKNVNSTWNGLLTFGEQITSFKQLLRRYQPYGHFAITKSQAVEPIYADYVVPVMPQGLSFDVGEPSAEKRYTNRIRDGPIPIIASGYRFFRGSVRMRLVIDSDKDGVVWVQHRPEYTLKYDKIFAPDMHYSDNVFQPGYATMFQFTNMNNVVEFEVPFYLPGQFGMLQRPDLDQQEDAVHYSMGNLYIGFDTIKGSPRNVPMFTEVFYSMGDDMSFSVFQGFPPMIDLSVFDQPYVRSEGLSDWIEGRIANAGKKVVDDAVQKITTNISESESNDSDALNDSIVGHIEKMFPELSIEKKTLLFNMLSQLIHVSINPSIGTIAWSIANIFINIGVVAMSYLEKMVNALKKFIGSLSRLCSQANKSEPAVVQAQGPNDEAIQDKLNEAAFISTCVTGMLALGQATKRPLPDSLPNFAKYLYDGMPRFTLTANGLFRFISNNLMMFKKIWYWIVSKFNKDYVLYSEMEEASESLVLMIKRIQWCLDSRNAKTVRCDIRATTQVYELANVAQAYLCKIALCSIKKPMPVFEMYLKRIIKLRDELTQEMLSPSVRFEPYVISFNGPSNVGKSHLAQTIAKELLHSINYKTYDEIVYTRTPGNAYWNGLRNQPVCLFDDFLNIEDSTHSLISLGELYCLKSKAVFNPPMAAIEEKKLRYNPVLVLLCNNKAFPKINGLGCEEAWMRRRDLLIEVKKTDEYKNVHPRNLPREIKKSYGHLRFAFYTNPAGNTSDTQQHESKWYTYEELLPVLFERFNEYFYEECEQYDTAIKELKKFYPDNSDENAVILDKLEAHVKQLEANRVNDPEEVEKIRKIQMDLHNNVYTADMTKYVKHQIAKKKMEQIDALAQATSAGVVSSVSEPQPSTSAIVSQGPSVDYAKLCSGRTTGIIGKYGVFATHNLSSISVDKLDARYEKFGSELQEKLMTHDCVCAQDLYCATSVLSSSVGLEFEISFNSYRNRLSMFKDLSYTKLWRECELKERCALNCEEVARWIWEHPPHMLLQIPDCNLPKILCDTKPRLIVETGASSTVTLMNDDQIDSIIADEVCDKAWYKKLWESIPTWGTVFKWLLKLTAIFVAVGALIRVGMSLFSIRKENECREAKFETDLLREKALKISTEDFIEKVKNKTVWENERYNPMGFFQNTTAKEQGYSTGTVGSKANPAFPVKAIAQASEQQEDVMVKLIKRNTFWLMVEFTTETGARSTKQYKCLGLCKNYFLMLDHYVQDMMVKKNPIVRFAQQHVLVVLPPETFANIRSIDNSAFYIGQMPAFVPMFRNIVKFFVRAEMGRNMSLSATLFEYVVDDEHNIVMKAHNFQTIKRQHRVEVINDSGTLTIVSTSYSYPKGGRGMCGSVLVSNSNLVSPILGIHVAGMSDGTMGYAETVCYEQFSFLLEKTTEPLIVENSAAPIELSDNSPILDIQGNIIKVGTVPRQYSVSPPVKSRLVHTECHGYITESTYDKPVLSPTDERIEEDKFSPLLEGCKHQVEPPLPMEWELVRRATEDVNDIYMAYIKPQRADVGVLSYEHAICGIPGNENYDGMAMDTSEGYPWLLKRPKGASNKSWLFDREETPFGWKLKGINKELSETLLEREEGRRQGLCYETVFVNTLKDAKLPKEKVLLPGKTRIFSTCPVDYTIIHRMYTMDFVAALVKARILTGHAVGINIHSREANDLVEYMREIGDNNICADYSKFGDRLYSDMIVSFYKLITHWYRTHCTKFDEGIANVHQALARETTTSYRMMLNLIYIVMCGMPSGNPVTVNINSYCNCIMIRVVYMKIMINSSLYSYLSLSVYRDHVREITYGDDLWLSVSDEIKDIFNAESMSKAFLEYGIKFTNASKSDTIIPYSSLDSEETSFLKCTFHAHETRANLWVARMDKRAVQEICNWTWNTQRDLQAASIEACKAMMELAHGHGSLYYEDLRRRIIDFWASKGVFVSLPTWYEIDVRIYEE